MYFSHRSGVGALSELGGKRTQADVVTGLILVKALYSVGLQLFKKQRDK